MSTQLPYDVVGFNPASVGKFFRIEQRLVSVTGGPVQVCGNDPTRVYLYLFQSGGGATSIDYYQVGGTGTNRPKWPATIGSGIELKYSDVGPLVGFDWYATVTFGPVNVAVITVSYDPYREEKVRPNRKSQRQRGSRFAAEDITRRWETR